MRPHSPGLAFRQKLTSAANPSDNFGDFLDGVRVPQNIRIPFTLTTRFSGLPAGTYTFGLCGFVTVAASLPNWNNNEWSRTQVTVSTP